MSKQSTITNLLVIPLIASPILLAGPALAAGPMRTGQTEIRNVTNQESVPTGRTNTKKRGVAGTVTSISGTIIVVTTKDNVQYTVDASHAPIMKAGTLPNSNPALVNISDIKVGDAIVARGVIKDMEITASKILDGKIPAKKHGKMVRANKMHTLGLKHF